MINALLSSKENGTKAFGYDGEKLGWAPKNHVRINLDGT